MSIDGRQIGFTGTQKGMTERQRVALAGLISQGCLHHGDCIGADLEAHLIARGNGMGVVIHPPINRSKRAFCSGDLYWGEKPYLARNRDIVDASQELIAAPASVEEEVRSGTWSTVRYARKRGRPVTIIYPDGSVAAEAAPNARGGEAMAGVGDA